MGEIICLRCRKPLDPATGECPHCALPAAPADQDHKRPAPSETEFDFLLGRAVELTDLESPSFMGFPEEDVKQRALRVPPLPLGAPRVMPDAAEPFDRLKKKLAAGDARERAMAAVQLAGRPEAEALLELLRRLGDRDADVRSCALWSIARTANPLVLPPLMEYEKYEKDVTVRGQLAATLYTIVTRTPPLPIRVPEHMETVLSEARSELCRAPSPDAWIRLGKLYLRGGNLLRGLGAFTRAAGEDGVPTPEALLYRSQAFLLLGRPLFAMDDLIRCPLHYHWPPIYHLHKVALMALARQIVAAAREKGLNDYADLFAVRLESLGKKE